MSKLNLYLTERCNLSCPYCGNTAIWKTRKQKHFKKQYLERIPVDKKFTEILLCGGEPGMLTKTDMFSLSSHITPLNTKVTCYTNRIVFEKTL